MPKEVVKLPHDTDCESGVVCSIIQNPKWVELVDLLKPEHFYNRELASVFWACKQLISENCENLDTFNLTVKCNSNKGIRNIIERFGGESFISELVDNASLVARSTTDEFESIANRVVQLGFRRKVYADLDNYKTEILDENKQLDIIHSNISNAVDSLAEVYLCNGGEALFKDRVDSYLAQLEQERKMSEDGVFGLKWFNDDITKAFGGIVRGELYAISARKKIGKSFFLLNQAIFLAQMGLKVSFTSSEMSSKKDLLRMISIVSGIPIDDLKIGRINDHSRQKYLDAIHFVKHADFNHTYEPIWTPESVLMSHKATKHKLGGLDVAIHDYVKSSRATDAAIKASELGYFTDVMKNRLAGDLDIPVITALQLNKAMDIANSDEIGRYITSAMLFEKKTPEEIVEHGQNCGNYKLSNMFTRDGCNLDDGDWLDLYVEQGAKANLRIHSAKSQHENVPEFMEED